MSKRSTLYQVVASSGKVLSQHRTRTAAVDAWRMEHTGVHVQIFRSELPSAARKLIVEGTWHEAQRP